jgi:hypothetical protein
MSTTLKTAVYKKILGSFALLATAISFASYANAQYAPANFGDAVDQLASKVSLPASFGADTLTIAVYCQADVPVTGSLANAICFESTGNPLKQQTVDALEELTFVPAEDNGQAVPVRMQFRVIYSRTGNQPEIVLLPNLGTLQTQHGFNYFAPQERLEKSAWFEKYLASNTGKGKVFFEKGRLTRVIATVKTDGSVESVSTLDARGSGKRDAATVEKMLQTSAFIPGFVDNKATEMHYVAVLNYAK